jgi:hypothetical protein
MDTALSSIKERFRPKGKKFVVERDLTLDAEKVIHNPDDDFYREFLKPYYVLTKDGQYLFASTQPGRRPDRVFYMVPEGYRLGKKQRRFDTKIGKKIYEVALKYLREVETIVMEGVQGESGYETGLRITISVDNPHSAYIGWMGKLMVFPPKEGMSIDCFNYAIPEGLPEEYVEEVKEIWPEWDPNEPITLFDFTEMDQNRRRVLSLKVDYFGGAFKKPNLTMVWNKGEAEGMISYHAGCTRDRIIKGLSGTGKTTLTVGPDIEQDDAILGKPFYKNGKIEKVQLIGLEAASFAKSEGLTPQSPEWVGLMKSKQVDEHGNRPVVLAMNIDCEGVEYVYKKIGKYVVKVPRPIPGQEVGSLTPTKYEKSGTTNGRFVFKFSELNKNWGKDRGPKWLKSEGLCFKRFDIVEPAFRVIDPKMAVALDSACESVITSAIAGQKVGKRVRSYSATDFMAREQSQQALLKLKVYNDLGLGFDGKLVFFVLNTGYVGEYDVNGRRILKLDDGGEPIPKRDPSGKVLVNEEGEVEYEGQGEKITVRDTKTLLHLIEHRLIKNWIKHPVYGYLIPDPRELEEEHGLDGFSKRFNPLRYYTPEEYIEFIKRDIKERTEYLEGLFKGQEGEEELQDVIYLWTKLRIPSPQEIKEFYDRYYGPVA